MSTKELYEYLLTATQTAFDPSDNNHLDAIGRGIAYNDSGILRPRCFQGPQTYQNAIHKSLARRLAGDNQ